MTTLSLHDLNNFKLHPESKSCIVEYEAKVFGNYEEHSAFVQRITNEIDNIIIKLESARNYYNKQPEDTITHIICMLLQQKSIDAHHGEYSSGATDLTVKHGKNLWIGEAKWWRQDENALEGMRQLSTRYANGGDNANSGGVLLYNSSGNLADKVERLKQIYKNKGDEFVGISVLPCEISNFAFKTMHKNPSSGLDYEVRHRALNFFHNPQDKSARKRSSSEIA